jgi:hypothetical protein
MASGLARAERRSSRSSRLFPRPEWPAHPSLKLDVVVQAHAVHFGTDSVHHRDWHVEVVDVEHQVPGPSPGSCRPHLEYVVAKGGDNTSARGLPIRKHRSEGRLEDGTLLLLRGLEVRRQAGTEHKDAHRGSLGHLRRAAPITIALTLAGKPEVAARVLASSVASREEVGAFGVMSTSEKARTAIRHQLDAWV